MKEAIRIIVSLAVILIFSDFSVGAASSPIVPDRLPDANGISPVPKDHGCRYIIEFDDPPLARHGDGNDPSSAMRVSSTGRYRLDPDSPASVAYRSRLRQRRNRVREGIEHVIGRSLPFMREYSIVVNGAVVEMDPREAAAIDGKSGVRRIHPDIQRAIRTDAGPAWIGAKDVWASPAGTCGEGIVIGVIDSGINPESPSFADVGDDGYDHNNPRGRFYGVCDSANGDYDAEFPCNDKLIGAYDFTPLIPESDNVETPYDVMDHGSHVSSTAAGNVVFDAILSAPTIDFNRDISGVAPHANLISYRTQKPNGYGHLSVLVAAIEQAVIDGVDVINYSIGGDANNPWTDLDAQAFLAARQAGIVVVTSAGNDGPEAGSVGSPGDAPWVLTVGASTHDRQFTSSLTGMIADGGNTLEAIAGKSIGCGYGPARIVYAGDYPNANDPDGDPGLCLEPYPAGTFNGEIVVCDRGQNARVEKGENVLQGGAGGYVLANDAANDDSLNADAHFLPAVHISYTDGVSLKNWLATGSNHAATIAATAVDIDPLQGDVMASFSSRGENISIPSVVKPDVVAPGVDILAAGGSHGDVVWEIMGGTSMSSPHAAGAAALVMASHPFWTPAEIQSALMTSASTIVSKADGATPADPFDRGAGRIRLPEAVRAGIVLDESHEDFVAADPLVGGDPAALNLASLGQARSVGATVWNRDLRGSADETVQWTATVDNPPGVTLTVTPPQFTLAQGALQSVDVKAETSLAALGQWLMGQVILTPDTAAVPPARFPVAVKAVASNLPALVAVNDAAVSGGKTLPDTRAITISDFTGSQWGLAPADTVMAELYQDPTPEVYLGQSDYQPEDGVHLEKRYFYAGSRRLVFEITDTTSPDLDMYLWYWDGSNWHLLYGGRMVGSTNYWSIDQPGAGWYYVYVHNYAASDPDGNAADTFTLAIAQVPDSDNGNMSVAISNGRTSVPGGDPFDLSIGWSIDRTSPFWYGVFELGTDAGNPGNLGTVDVNIALACWEGDFEPDGDVDGADLVLLANDPTRMDIAAFAADFGKLAGG